MNDYTENKIATLLAFGVIRLHLKKNQRNDYKKKLNKNNTYKYFYITS